MQYLPLMLFLLCVGFFAGCIALVAGLISPQSRVACAFAVAAIALALLPTVAWIVIDDSDFDYVTFLMSASPALLGLIGLALSIRSHWKWLDPPPLQSYRWRFTLGRMFLWTTILCILLGGYWQIYYRFNLGQQHIDDLVQGHVIHYPRRVVLQCGEQSLTLTATNELQQIVDLLWFTTESAISDQAVTDETIAAKVARWGEPADRRALQTSWTKATAQFRDGAIGEFHIECNHTLNMVSITYQKS